MGATLPIVYKEDVNIERRQRKCSEGVEPNKQGYWMERGVSAEHNHNGNREMETGDT